MHQPLRFYQSSGTAGDQFRVNGANRQKYHIFIMVGSNIATSLPLCVLAE